MHSLVREVSVLKFCTSHSISYPVCRSNINIKVHLPEILTSSPGDIGLSIRNKAAYCDDLCVDMSHRV